MGIVTIKVDKETTITIKKIIEFTGNSLLFSHNSKINKNSVLYYILFIKNFTNYLKLNKIEP